MIIHVVKEGETASSIAKIYDVSEERLIIDNQITSPNNLVVGETLVILFPAQTYTIQEGDTLQDIADKFSVSVMQLLRNNPYLSDRKNIYPGESIVIRYTDEKNFKLSTNGYAYPFIDKDILKKTLPFLTYLTIFSYTVTIEGDILEIQDEDVIQIARLYGVAPIMMLIATGENQSDEINVTHNLLINEAKQDKFIDNLISIMKKKGYYGVNLASRYIYPADRSLYASFVIKTEERMRNEGFKLFTTFLLTSFEIITNTIYEDLKYATLAQIVDSITFISYQIGYTIGTPASLISLESLRSYVSNLIKEIPPEKLIIGTPVNGYIWQLPYVPGITKGIAITSNAAVDLARERGVNIEFDEITKAAYFHCFLGDEYIVRFPDARSLDAYLNLITEFNLNGIVIWNIMIYFPQLWLIINSQYEIEKIL